MTGQSLRLFVSSPGDVISERRRVELVIERLNAEFAGRVRIETVRWELSYYSAHETFQRQIPEAADCDLVVAIFRGRLGTPLPEQFPRLPTGEPYPSGSAYEVISAIEVRRAGRRVPDVYVFRYPNAPAVALDAPDRVDIETQWERLKGFFDRWFRNQQGEFLAAFHTYLSTDDLAQKVEDCLRQWLARRGFVTQGPVWDRIVQGSPFPGLEAFNARRSPVFFGRDLVTDQALDRLRAGHSLNRLPFLLLIGASGSGKSSLLRAGLLPRLTLPGAIAEVDLWRTAVMTAGADPLTALADALFDEAALGGELRDGLFRTKEMLARLFRADPDSALAPIADALGRAAVKRQAEAGFTAPRPVRLALGIDQAERLFSEATPDAAERFAVLLSALARRGLATVLMALRSDAYAGFQGSEVLIALREAGATLDLMPPTPSELEEMVTRPVNACQPALVFESRDGHVLSARLVADVRGGDALPLLQVCLARLYAAEAARGDGLLRFADYRGMDAAVTETANEALAGLDAAARAELPALVAALVADVIPDARGGVPVPVVAALDRPAFEAGRPARGALLDAFIGRRLLTLESDAGRVIVRPVHEALLRIWPEAVAIVADTASLIRVRRTLEPLVREWEAAGRGEGYLDLSPALLDGALALMARFAQDLPAPIRDFVTQAAAKDAQRRDRERAEQEQRVRNAQALARATRNVARRTMVGLVAALVLAGLAGWQWYLAGVQRDRAQHTLSLATRTSLSLVHDLADRFSATVGVPAATVKDIMDRAENLQNQLLAEGETTPRLEISHADAELAQARMLRVLGDVPAALAKAREANAILSRFDGGTIDVEQNYSLSFAQIGVSLSLQGDTKGALDNLDRAYKLREAYAAAHPDNVSAARDQAETLTTIGDVKMGQLDHNGAAEAYETVLAISRRLAAARPDSDNEQRNLAVAGGKLGAAQQAQHDLDAALRSFEASVAVTQKLSEAHPDNTAYLRDIAIYRQRIGETQRWQGRYADALGSYGAALATMQRLVQTDASNTEWRRDLALLHSKVGETQQQAGDLDAAFASDQAALAIRQLLGAADPSNTMWQGDIAYTQAAIAEVEKEQNHLIQALESQKEAVAILLRLANTASDDAGAQFSLSVAESGVGRLALAMKDYATARDGFQAMLDAATRGEKLQPGNNSMELGMSLAHQNLGGVATAKGDLPEAIAQYKAALAITGKQAAAKPGATNEQGFALAIETQIAVLQHKAGEEEAARASYEAALHRTEAVLQQEPANEDWLTRRGTVLDALAQIDLAHDDTVAAVDHARGAETVLKALLAKAPLVPTRQANLATAEERLGETLRAAGDAAGARLAYEAAVELYRKVMAALPANRPVQREAARDLGRVAQIAWSQGDRQGGQDAFNAANEILAKLVAASPDNPTFAEDQTWLKGLRPE
jgi:tetratricopeptide (TPR) repeat protein